MNLRAWLKKRLVFVKQLKVQGLRKIEDLQVERRRSSHGPAHGGEGWAVSYADMLMVLLSFFVMFFSLKEESPQTFNDELSKISLSMKSLGENRSAGATAPAGHQPASVAENATSHPAVGKDYSALAEALKIEGITVINEKSQLVLTLDDTAFAKANYSPNGRILGKVDQIVERLRPYSGKVQVTIVGHTDASRLRPRNDFLQDNFDLSSLRALRVLKHVLAKGFPENRATARAASSFDRDARSVSFVIQLIDASQTSKPETGA